MKQFSKIKTAVKNANTVKLRLHSCRCCRS